jgi:hypothetical protein
MAGAVRWFIPVWLVAAAVNMWIGVTRAGYSVGEEAPICRGRLRGAGGEWRSGGLGT